MSATSNTPTNLNFQGPQNFKFILNRTKMVEFFLQECNLPEISMPVSTAYTPLNNIPWPGNEMTYAPLHISFILGEDWKNYLELHQWFRGIAAPESSEEYRLIKSSDTDSLGVKSDIKIIVLSSKKNPTAEITYIDAFPVSLKGLIFATNPMDAPVIKIEASFRYTLFNIELSTG